MKFLILASTLVLPGILASFSLSQPAFQASAEMNDRVLHYDGKELMAKGATLEAQRKFQEAGDAYQGAADAFEREARSSDQAKALSKLASMLEKHADELIGGTKAPQTTPPPRPANPPRKVTPPQKPAPPAAGGPWKVGDKVESYNITWTEGTVIEIGSGNYAGYYRIHWDQGSNPGGQWISAANVRARQSKVKPDTSHGPRAGKYLILSYGDVTNPIRGGYFTLSGSSYQYFTVTGKPIGSGGYSYNAGTHSVSWSSGPFKDAHFTGIFRIDREGKTHIIQLNTATVGSNSTDS